MTTVRILLEQNEKTLTLENIKRSDALTKTARKVKSAPAPYKSVKLKRSGQRPLMFSGMLLLQTELDNSLSAYLKIWETSDKHYVAQVAIKNSETSDIFYNKAFEAHTFEQLISELMMFDPSCRLSLDFEALLTGNVDTVKKAYQSLEDKISHSQKSYRHMLSRVLRGST